MLNDIARKKNLYLLLSNAGDADKLLFVEWFRICLYLYDKFVLVV